MSIASGPVRTAQTRGVQAYECAEHDDDETQQQAG